MNTILIIDDDCNINNLLYEALSKEGYQIFRAWSGTEAFMLLEQKTPDLILLDLMLPGLSGEELMQKIKGIPIIVISAKADIENKVKLLENGAVDYITKPFDLRELSVRIRLRLKESQKNEESSRITCGEITVDTVNRTVSINGVFVKLTRTEYAILKLLCLNPDIVMTKNAILERICEDTPDCVENSLNVHIFNLRKKLKSATDREYIESVWGIGYKLNLS